MKILPFEAKAFLLITLALTALSPRLSPAATHTAGPMQGFEFPEERTYGPGDQGFSQYAAASLRGTKKLALTFDDGPSAATTPVLLDTLAKYNVKATFFVVGELITNNTLPIVLRMLRDGHTVGSHDWTHDNNWGESQAKFKSDLKKSIIGIKKAESLASIFQNEMYFRYPYGAYNYHDGYHHMNALREVSYELFNENCINFVFWNIDTADWVSAMTPQDIKQNIVAQFEGGTAFTHDPIRDSSGRVIGYRKKAYTIKNPPKGGVALLHDVHQRSVEAVPLILDFALKSGIQIVPLQEVREYEYGSRRCELQQPVSTLTN
jgi:peptidoglycan-N-acetylglucosamine deacetylase